MGLAVYFGYRITYQNRSVIMLNSTTHGVRYANARRAARYDAGGHPHAAQNGVERCVGETAKALLYNQMLPFPGLEFVHDLRAPCSFHAMGLIAPFGILKRQQGN